MKTKEDKPADAATAVSVTVHKTVTFKIKGVVIEMTPQELEDLHQKISVALGKTQMRNDLDSYREVMDKVKKAERDRPHWDRPYHPPPPLTIPSPARPGYFQPDVICTTGDPIPPIGNTCSI